MSGTRIHPGPDPYLPLHEKVGRALGLPSGAPSPRYDTDWSATGPLIVRYAIKLRPIALEGTDTVTHWEARARGHRAHVETSPLEAVCVLILALAKAGQLR